MRLALSSIGGVCTATQFASDACPTTARLGSATVATPLLADPLAGSVFLVSLPGQPLPGIGISLHGPISLRLTGSVTIAANGALTNTFDGLPDVPLSRFELSLDGGPKGPIAVAEDLCRGPVPMVSGNFKGQNGVRIVRREAVAVACCPTTPKAALRLRGRKTTASARPAGSQAGTASARTPLLPVALSGPVFLATRSDGSPGLAVRLGGIITLSLDGTLDIGAAGVSTTFDGIPDVPLERFELSLAGGPHGALAVGTDLCRGRPPAVSAAFTAHSGAATADARAATVAGCSRRPLTSVSIRDQASGRPSLRLIVQRSRAGAPLTSCGWACRRRCG